MPTPIVVDSTDVNTGGISVGSAPSVTEEPLHVVTSTVPVPTLVDGRPQ